MTRSPFYRINIFLIATILSAALAFLTHFFVPTILENLILKNLLLSPNSASYGAWQKSNIPIYSKFYFFNLTNAEQVVKGEKPVLQEVGPYTFRFAYEKVNISWDEGNGTVQYRTIKQWIYQPSLNSRSLDDEIVHFNVPLISAIYAIEAAPKEEHYTALESLNSLIEAYQMSAILRTKVRHLLFDGYSDALLEAASNFYPSQVSQSKFGWFYGRNNTSNDGLYRIFTGQGDKGLKLGLLDTWNGEKSLVKWPPSETCRSLERTSASDFQPPFFLTRNQHFLDYLSKERVQMPEPTMRIFFGDLCRAFEMQLKEEDTISYRGLLGYRYRADANVFNYSLPENKCFCQHGCPPSGLYDMGLCAKGSPIFMSFPHFLHANSSLRDQVVGLSPSEREHELYFDYSKNLAITMEARIRLQVNLLIRKNSQIEIMADWQENFHLYLPQFWSVTMANIDDSTVRQLDFVMNLLPLLLFLSTVALAIGALAFLSYVCFIVITNQMLVGITEIPKYESVSILPNIETKEGSSDYNMRQL